MDAVEAGAAGNGEGKDNCVAYFVCLHSRADGGDCTGCFVALVVVLIRVFLIDWKSVGLDAQSYHYEICSAWLMATEYMKFATFCSR